MITFVIQYLLKPNDTTITSIYSFSQRIATKHQLKLVYLFFHRHPTYRNRLCFLQAFRRGMIQNAHIKIGSNSYEKVKTFKYVGSLLTNQNYIQETIKCRLKAGNSCYYSVQTLLSSRILSKNLKIKIFKTIILPVVLMVVKNGILH